MLTQKHNLETEFMSGACPRPLARRPAMAPGAGPATVASRPRRRLAATPAPPMADAGPPPPPAPPIDASLEVTQTLPVWPTCATAARSRRRNTRPRSRSCSAGC